MDMPNDEVMKEMAKLAIEQSTTYFAKMAEQFADEMERGDGPRTNEVDALRAFETAIRNTNQTNYPRRGTT